MRSIILDLQAKAERREEKERWFFLMTVLFFTASYMMLASAF